MAKIDIFELMFRTIIITVFLLLNLLANAQQRSFQIWNQNSIEISLSDKTLLKFSEKIHATPGNETFDLKFADVFLAREFNHWFEAGGGCRIAGISKDYGWLTEYRSMIYGNFEKESRNLELNFSNRFEYRTFNKADNHFRHKQKFTVEFPVLTAWNLRFYVAEETFEKFTKENLHLARLYGGIQVFELEHIQMKLYYILEKYKSVDVWNTRDIVGLNFSVEL